MRSLAFLLILTGCLEIKCLELKPKVLVLPVAVETETESYMLCNSAFERVKTELEFCYENQNYTEAYYE